LHEWANVTRVVGPTVGQRNAIIAFITAAMLCPSILIFAAGAKRAEITVEQSEDRPRSRQDNNGSAISPAVEVSIYRFEFIAIAQPPVLNSYPNADML
jgi:hypothetical protein